MRMNASLETMTVNICARTQWDHLAASVRMATSWTTMTHLAWTLTNVTQRNTTVSMAVSTRMGLSNVWVLYLENNNSWNNLKVYEMICTVLFYQTKNERLRYCQIFLRAPSDCACVNAHVDSLYTICCKIVTGSSPSSDDGMLIYIAAGCGAAVLVIVIICIVLVLLRR